MNSERNRVRRADLDQVFPLDVVHLDMAVEAPRELRRDERLQLLATRAPGQASGDEQRLVAGRDTEPLELVDSRGDGGLPRILFGSRQRQLRRFDHDRDACAPRHERLERLAGEREAQRIANRRADVRDRVAGWRRPEHERVVCRSHDDEA